MQDKSTLKTVCFFIGLFITLISSGQPIEKKLNMALKGLEADEQFRHAIISLYVVDGITGTMIYDRNSQLGLAPASCQKVITSASSFELLGKTYQFRTQFAYDGTLNNSTLTGNVYFIASGDPTLGSWRWMSTNEDKIKQSIIAAINVRELQRSMEI